ncbi:MATE family efflux transporter [Erysipelothrix rhusiopathiae]|nr:MATE family efflux transporter [Erysipelothrix rhusiopathiae]
MEVIKNTKPNILSGNIKRVLFALAIPIILSNFIQTLLGIVDMIWIGKLGSEAVSAIGTASFYINLSTALTTLVCIGSGIKIAHSIGSQDKKSENIYTKNGFVISIILAMLYVIIVGLFSNELITYFGMNNLDIESMAVEYLRASLYGVPFLFLVTYFITVLTSYGETKITFKANSIGLILNIIVDPILIFGFGPVPAMGVSGAAWATNVARIIILLILVLSRPEIITRSLKAKAQIRKAFEVMKMSFPVTLQRIIFIYISMIMAKIIVQFGTDAIAVQKIGVQIESISYVTIGGLQGAISAFIGQNYGNGNNERIKNGYNIAIKLVLFFGVLVTTVMLLFPKQLFSIFINDPQIIGKGIVYMQAIAFSQLFMCVELLTVGAFNGIGKTYVPPIVSIMLTLLRIPLALFLSSKIGINGVWWSISISSILKGTVLYFWFKLILSKEKYNNEAA